MGEYATRKSDGENIKIGTCEDMYYLRFDQRRQVKAEDGNVDPVADAAELRFRFPWPDEDTLKPGDFDDYHRSLHVRVDAPEGVGHGSIQFTHAAGYLLSMPCPEGGDYTTPTDPSYPGSRMHSDHTKTGFRIHRNGFNGGARLVAQKFRPGIGLVPIMKCGSCGSMWRMEDRADIERLAVALRSEADRNKDKPGSFLHTVADRVLAGILETVEP